MCLLMIEKIPISLLHSQVYCEYQIFLERVRGIEVEPTEEMKVGKEVHSLLEDEHKKRAKLELSIPDAMKKSIKEKITLIGREIRVFGNLLYGKIDEVHFMPSQIIIIDDKPNDYPYLSNKKQIWGYCLAFEEHFNPGLPLLATLRQRDTQEIFWEKEFIDEDKDMVLESAQRILDVLNGKRQPEPTLNIKKCRSCRHKDGCDKCNINR